MTSPADPETRYMQAARRWFTEGWTGDLAMASRIFSEELRTNGVYVGVAGPVSRIRDRLAAFPDLSPMMALTHCVCGIGDTISIGVQAAETALGQFPEQLDEYVERLEAALGYG